MTVHAHHHPACKRPLAVALGAATLWSIVGVASISAQTGPARRDVPSRDARQDEGRETTDRETRVITLGPAGFLELRTVSGDITITAGSGRDVKLEIIRRVRARTEEEAKRLLATVRVDVDHQGERASVVTVQPSQRRSSIRADVAYVVIAPAGTRIGASSLSGNLSVRDIKGELTAALIAGSIAISRAEQVSSARTISGDISLTDTSTRAAVSVATVSGNVIVDDVRADRLDVEAGSGAVTARNVSTNRASVRSLSGPIDFSGSLARGGRYEFQSHSGDVRVATAGAGFMLQAGSFSGLIRPDPAVALKAVSASQRALRGTVGDGSAVLVATTFSGNVSIERK